MLRALPNRSPCSRRFPTLASKRPRIALLLVVTLGLALALTRTQAADLIINEFMADNASTLQDEDGDFSDWIELQNVSSRTLTLEGWHLTDDPSRLSLWTIPATNLAPGSFLVVFASSKDRAVPGRTLHTNFQLDNLGEYLGLVRPDGVTVEIRLPLASMKIE